ncbi:LysR family transcriptional regulator [Xaviernesmea oryzae]|uniref:HTH-type transcriptional regulator TtuA n=1 Tax=Xaviernesmea oryzae TaxID=464029 RepID=A0A1Q9B2T9_9HYPH|nr:LysR family transcriptional regulator [Xaviernesmea oryzae]OLP62327.1 LysR family transcriptional regulator [Xaviernesmea oryzae]SEL96927.1 DNA-binding transcriptional regulator, LysR family [Xaviernesmea oryzae]
MEQLRDVPVFVEAAEAGSFSLAAARLNLTRSAVAKAIGRMEGRLGARLFHRTTRRQSLTEEGRFFYERCLRAVEEIRAGEALIESGRREVRGRLRVSMPVVFGRTCVAPILVCLMRDHPGLELDLSFSDRVVDMVEEGFDLCIRNGLLKDEPDLMARRIAFQRMTVCAAPSYLARHGTPEQLEDLGAHDGLLYARRDQVRSWIFPTAEEPMRAVIPKARLRVDDLQALLDAACAGLGLAWLPCWMVRDAVRDGRLVQVLTHVPSIHFSSHAVWLKTPVMLPKLRIAIDRLAADLPDRMGVLLDPDCREPAGQAPSRERSVTQAAVA